MCGLDIVMDARFDKILSNVLGEDGPLEDFSNAGKHV